VEAKIVLIHNGIPDGLTVRLASLEEKHFPTATKVVEKPDGSLEIWFDRIFLHTYSKGEHLSHWFTVRERPRKKRIGTKKK
jgi:hypothetical protein